MKPGRILLHAGDGLLDRVICVLGAISFSQGPEFIQQYLQRLGGHVTEARAMLEKFRQTAADSGLSLEAFIERTNGNSDTAVARLGGVMASQIERVQSLEASQSAISQAAAWERPFVFLRHVDSSIASDTWSIFKPALPLSAEGIIYALAGMLLLLTTYHAFLRYPAMWLARRGRAPIPEVTPRVQS